MSGSWLLAFDATCCTCRSMSEVVADACDGRLAVVPLDRDDVRELRQRAFGAEPPRVPTLLHADGDDVRAFTGAGLAIRLTRLLGLRSGARVARALGAAVRAPEPDSVDQVPASGLNRRAFVQLGAGTAVAAGLLVAGRKPAAFATPQQQQVKAWVARNRASLPTDYDQIVAKPLAYRKAIYAELSSAQRRALWLTQLDRFARQEAPLTAPQSAAVADTRALFTELDLNLAGTGHGPSLSVHRRVQAVRARMDGAFGPAATARVLGELGPSDPVSADPALADPAPSSGRVGPHQLLQCACNRIDVYCTGYCAAIECANPTSTGCGSGYIYPCNGICQ